ncbi:MAG TPA: hypothetical protein VFP91_02275 [Vicinamibacterales bacterium]|nr:hypothetical protein [Vicinamibacterales bacterium]
MKRETTIVFIVSSWFLSATTAAQWLHYPTSNVPRTRDGKANLSAPAPRLANGRPDFSGVWENDGYDPSRAEGLAGGPPKTAFFDIANGMSGAPPYQPWAADLAKKRRAEFSKDNPDARCLPLGALQMMAHPLPKKILHTPGVLAILHERNMEFRQIFTDGRPLPADRQPSWSGYSSGKWESDVLVVQTAGLRDGLWADFNGSPLTDAATLTERFRRPAFGRLEVDVTVDDPKAYTRPWTIRLSQHIALDTDLLEYACLENEKDVAHFPGAR